MSINILEMVEAEMVQLWADSKSIPKLLKEDPEFVGVIIDGIMLERSFWSRNIIVGEAWQNDAPGGIKSLIAKVWQSDRRSIPIHKSDQVLVPIEINTIKVSLW